MATREYTARRSPQALATDRETQTEWDHLDSMNVVIAGPDDRSIGPAIEAEGHTVTNAPLGNRPGLEEAGIHEADVYLLTDFEQATSIAVAKDLNPEVRVVAYADGSLPDFASRQTDLVIDPQLLDAAAVAEEL